MTANDTESLNGDDTAGTPAGREGQSPSSPDVDAQMDHAARADLLAEENRRLRAEYARAKRSRYRRSALGLAVIGLLAVLGGFVFPASREVLFALGATGLFGAVLTLYLTPGQFVTADVGERVYAAMAENEAAFVAELGLSDRRIYLPTGDNAARLYVPQHSDFELPDAGDSAVIVDETSRGLLLEATGGYLFEEFERALSGDLAMTPAPLATQLADGIVEQFELAASVEPDLDVTDGRITFGVDGSVFGDLDRLDHPVVSVLATGLAVGLDQPVSVDVTAGEDRTDWLVTCRWDTADSG